MTHDIPSDGQGDVCTCPACASPFITRRHHQMREDRGPAVIGVACTGDTPMLQTATVLDLATRGRP